MCDTGEPGSTMTSAMDSCAGPDIAPFSDTQVGAIYSVEICLKSTFRHLQGSDQFGEEEFRPATEVFSQGAPGDFDLDFLQQHGTQSSSVSHLARLYSHCTAVIMF